jgi:hypothetical protein
VSGSHDASRRFHGRSPAMSSALLGTYVAVPLVLLVASLIGLGKR